MPRQVLTPEQRASDRLLRRLGWRHLPKRGKGSHRLYRHPDGNVVTVGIRDRIGTVRARIDGRDSRG